MGDEERIINELRQELATLRQRVRQLERLESAHKETLEDLRDREANYRLLFSAETDAIIIVDADTERITDANQAAENLYGYSREEFLQLSATDLSAEPAKSAEHIREVASGAPAVAAEGPVHRFHKKRDGTVISVERSVCLMRSTVHRCGPEAPLAGSDRGRSPGATRGTSVSV